MFKRCILSSIILLLSLIILCCAYSYSLSTGEMYPVCTACHGSGKCRNCLGSVGTMCLICNGTGACIYCWGTGDTEIPFK